MRLFIALNFDDSTIANILAIQSELKKQGQGSFSLPQNIHLTLAFLGEIEAKRLDDIKSAMNKLTMPKLHLIFSHSGKFSRPDGDICWLGLENNQDLQYLQADLSKNLIASGFVLEKRKFTPHITIARRFKSQITLPNKAALQPTFATDISRLSLMLSTRVNGKLTYQELYAVEHQSLVIHTKGI